MELGRKEMAIVDKIVNRLYSQGILYGERDEHVSAGLLGLAEAAARYDQGRGIPFSRIAPRYIKGRILDDLRKRCRWWKDERSINGDVSVEDQSLSATGHEGAGCWGARELDARESQLHSMEQRRRLTQAMRGLSRKQKNIIKLRFVEELTLVEIAKRYGTSGPGVVSIIRSSINRMRKHEDLLELQEAA